jgi:hypothetical protein
MKNPSSASFPLALLLLTAHVHARDGVAFTGDGIFPESITSLEDGTLFISSARRTIYRSMPGAREALPWFDIGMDAPRSTFGVLAHEATKTLFVCAGTLGDTAGAPPRSSLYQHDLTTGALRSRHELPNDESICNDIAVAANGAIYVTDTGNGQILRLENGILEIWSGPGPFGDRNAVLDGIAVLGDRVFVNTLKTNRLIAVEIRMDGSAGSVADIELDKPLNSPDGMRPIGDSTLVIAENRRPGRVVEVAVSGRRGALRELASLLPDGSVAVTLVARDIWHVAPFANGSGPPTLFHARRIVRSSDRARTPGKPHSGR